MVAGLSHSITQERRQIAWSRLNPVIKDISMEDTKKEKGATLFGKNFMEKATKRMERKALAKFTSSPKESPAPKRRKYTQDPTDLHRFLEKAHVLSTVAGSSSANSRTTRPTTGPGVSNVPSLNNRQDRPGNSQDSSLRGQLFGQTNNCMCVNILNILSHIPGLQSSLPLARLPHCLCNWQIITTD